MDNIEEVASKQNKHVHNILLEMFQRNNAPTDRDIFISKGYNLKREEYQLGDLISSAIAYKLFKNDKEIDRVTFKLSCDFEL